MLTLDGFIGRTREAGIALDAVTVLRDGEVLLLHRSTENVYHNVFSVSKSFLSTAVGMAREEGLLSLADRPAELFPDLFGEGCDSRWERVTLQDLLTMRLGNDRPWLMAKEREYLRGETEKQPPEEVRLEWLRYAFTRPLAHEPGTVFSYGNLAPYIAGRMLEKRAGVTVRDYLCERLWTPMEVRPPRWDTDAAGHTFPASFLFLDILDMVKLGELYLEKGVYAGCRYLPEEWVAMATARQCGSAVVNPAGRGRDEENGYGFYFWQTHVRGIYMAYGREGQFVIVCPAQRSVIGIQAMHHDVQQILDLVWEEIFPQL